MYRNLKNIARSALLRSIDLNAPSVNNRQKSTLDKKKRSSDETMILKNNQSNETKVKQIIDNDVNDDRPPLCCRSSGDVNLAIIGGGYAARCSTLLLKQNRRLKEIRLIDVDDSLGDNFVNDLRQIDTSTVVKRYERESLTRAARDCHIIALMDETDFTLGNQGPFAQLAWSANYVKNVAERLANIVNNSRNVIVVVFARPVTATLPIVHEVFKLHGYNDRDTYERIIGSVALEAMRMATITASHLNLDPDSLSITMAGGVDSTTVVPLLSRVRPHVDFTNEEHCKLVGQLRSIDQELNATELKGPGLSFAVATAKFIAVLVNGLTTDNNNNNHSIASAYTRNDTLTGCRYATNDCKFGKRGVVTNLGMPRISGREIELLDRAVPLIGEISRAGEIFVRTGRIGRGC